MLLIDGDELKSRIAIVINSTVEGDETNDQLRILSMIKHVLETAVEETPIIEAEPVIHAKWEKVSEIGSEYCCTNCQREISMNGSARRPEEVGWYYCKGCGAKMEKEETT